MNTEVVNRGYQKIKGAVSAFNFDFKDKIVLDIGSSTGGFTGYALDHGAKKVIAIEKGTNQMKAPLRFDPRVELHEKTDIFDISWQQASTTEDHGHQAMDASPLESPDVIMADVSFISLKPILTHLKSLKNNPDFLMMLKPQFEATENQLNKGIVKNEKIRREIIKDFEFWLKQNGFIIVNKRDNTLSGKHGNLERFYHLRLAK